MEYKIKTIPSGDLGTDATVSEMEKLIRDGVKEPLVRELAIGLVRGIAPKDYMGEISRIFQWVQQNIRYTRDPVALELLQSARRLLQDRAGDCDDFTILTSALLQAIGHQTRIKTIAVRPGEYHHVYPEVFVQGQWLPLDASHSLAIPGWQPPGIRRQKIYENLGGSMESYVKSNIDPYAILWKDLQTHIANRSINVKDLQASKELLSQQKIPGEAVSKARQMLDRVIHWIEQHPEYKKVESLAGMNGLGDFWDDVTKFIKNVAEVAGSIYQTAATGQQSQVYYPAGRAQTQTYVVQKPWYEQIFEPPAIYFLLGGLGLLLFGPKLLKTLKER